MGDLRRWVWKKPDEPGFYAAELYGEVLKVVVERWPDGELWSSRDGLRSWERVDRLPHSEWLLLGDDE